MAVCSVRKDSAEPFIFSIITNNSLPPSKGTRGIRFITIRFKEIRATSLASHAAARNADKFKEAQYAARAAGHAVATAHVTRHSIGAAIYATAVIRELNPDNIDVAAKKEGDWQYKHLVKLRKFKKYKL